MLIVASKHHLLFLGIVPLVIIVLKVIHLFDYEGAVILKFFLYMFVPLYSYIEE
jgi:hypothetical protein